MYRENVSRLIESIAGRLSEEKRPKLTEEWALIGAAIIGAHTQLEIVSVNVGQYRNRFGRSQSHTSLP